MAQQIRKERAIGDTELVTVTHCRFGRSILDDDPNLKRQAEAGEEDQSEPGWDQGA